MIEFKNVVKRFGARTVLDRFSFRVDREEILFILGVSGTGKSVALKLVVGLLDADQGEIEIDGQNTTHLSEAERRLVRRKCGIVFQQPALFDGMNVLENVAFGLRRLPGLVEREVIKKARRSLALVHLAGVEEKLPSEISYGIQKRVSLARTIALEPKAILFDEPTTGLDPVAASAINQLILELSRGLGTASVVVSHDMRCALEIADRIVVMDAGRAVAQGTPEEMRNSTHPLVQDFLREVALT